MNIDGLKALWKQAFGDTDTFLDGFFSVGFAEGRCNTIEKDGKPAAMLYWFDCAWGNKKVAYIYAVATDKAYRNQGLCRALLEDTHKQLQNMGYAGAVLVPGNRELFKLYGKLGYVPFCDVETVTVLAGNESAKLTALTAAQYGKKRILLLPESSVVQDGVTLDFLATFCDLYESEGCLFCGGTEEDIFYFQEFLGNPERIPGILKALGTKKGTLRLPGDTPFAMYRSLVSSEELPAYFGIPLN